MMTHEQAQHVGDVRCLNCGRVLAAAMRQPETGRIRLRPAINQSNVQVIVAGRRMLRCARCRGRAFVEYLVEPGEEGYLRPPMVEVA
jgi:hypothetical protein